MTSVLLLDDDQDLLTAMTEVVGVVGDFTALKFSGYSELVNAKSAALSCKVAIIDINLGPNSKNGIEACQWLLDKGYTGKIYFLTGHAHAHPLVTKAAKLTNIPILSKPISIEKLQGLLEGSRCLLN